MRPPTGLRVVTVTVEGTTDVEEADDAAVDDVDTRLVGWTDADGRDCPTRPSVRISEIEMVLPEAELDAFSGSKNCSSSLRLREAVSEADDDVIVP